MGPNERAYRESRQRIAALVARLEPAQLGQRVPACPAWTVHDVVAHLAGSAADGARGEASPEDRAEAQVSERRGLPVDAVLAEWDEVAATLEPRLDAGEPWCTAIVADVSTHEQDVRGVLGLPGGRDCAAATIALDHYVRTLGTRIVDRRLPALRLRAGDREWLAGEGPPCATVMASPWELTRALSGRRNRSQVVALTWDGDPAPWLSVFSAYPMRSRPLREA